MIGFECRGEFIELYKLLKAAGVCENGGMAKHAISEGLVSVDGAIEKRKACKIKPGQKVSFGKETIVVQKHGTEDI